MQPINTEYGTLHFHKIYKGQASRDPVTKEVVGANVSVGELVNGSWVFFPKGQTITNPYAARRLLGTISNEAVERFNDWWNSEQARRLDEESAPVVRPIKIVPCEEMPKSKLVYDDGSEEDVTQAGDVIAFYKGNDALQAFAMQIFGARYQHTQTEAARDALETPRAKMQREVEDRRAAKKPASLKSAEDIAMKQGRPRRGRGAGVTKLYEDEAHEG